MGFFNDFIRGATPAIEGGTNIGLRGMAEAQRKRELQDEIQRQTQQQAFVNMMNQQKFDAEQQQAAQGQQNWQQQFDTQNFNNQQGAIDEATRFRMGLENQLKQNSFEQQRLDLDKQQEGRIASSGGGNQQTQAFLAWYNAQPPEIQDEVMRTQAGLSPKAGTIRQPKPVDPIARLSYGTDYATKVMSQNPRLMESPNSFDSTRAVGMQEYDAAQAGAQGVSPEEEQALIQRESSIDQIIATMKQRLGIQ